MIVVENAQPIQILDFMSGSGSRIALPPAEGQPFAKLPRCCIIPSIPPWKKYERRQLGIRSKFRHCKRVKVLPPDQGAANEWDSKPLNFLPKKDLDFLPAGSDLLQASNDFVDAQMIWVGSLEVVAASMKKSRERE